MSATTFESVWYDSFINDVFNTASTLSLFVQTAFIRAQTAQEHLS